MADRRMLKLAPGTKRLRAVPDNRGLRGNSVLHYAVVFLVIALIAAVLGFGGIAAEAAGIAKLLFFVFVAMAVVAFLVNLARKR